MEYEEEAEAFKERNYRQKEKVCPISLPMELRWAGLEWRTDADMMICSLYSYRKENE